MKQNKFINPFSAFKSFVADQPLIAAELAGSLILNAVALKTLMILGWDPQDYGGWLNTAWRVLHGQKPYIDFYFHTTPMMIYNLALFLGLFGFSKTTIWFILVFHSSVASLLVF